jgi:hypothetical protein
VFTAVEDELLIFAENVKRKLRGTQVDYASEMVPRSLESQPCVKLNLTSATYGGEYSSNVVGEVTRCIFENSVSVPSQAERTLRVTRHSKIRMIKEIVSFRSERNLRAFGQLEALLDRQIKFRESGAAEAIPSGGTELIGGRHRKRARIKPA